MFHQKSTAYQPFGINPLKIHCFSFHLFLSLIKLHFHNCGTFSSMELRIGIQVIWKYICAVVLANFAIFSQDSSCRNIARDIVAIFTRYIVVRNINLFYTQLRLL